MGFAGWASLPVGATPETSRQISQDSGERSGPALDTLRITGSPVRGDLVEPPFEIVSRQRKPLDHVFVQFNAQPQSRGHFQVSVDYSERSFKRLPFTPDSNGFNVGFLGLGHVGERGAGVQVVPGANRGLGVRHGDGFTKGEGQRRDNTDLMVRYNFSVPSPCPLFDWIRMLNLFECSDSYQR